ncbi:MAG: glycosyltransferase family 4 protein [Candidatus Levybacteria bacterium]|nr:glycosyltransferase family 4 protein [Candidatus Levybacteria bacterium]
MKILITLTYYYPYISGLSIYTKNLAEELVKKGFNINILTSQHEKNLSILDYINGVILIRVPYSFKLHKGFIMFSYPIYVINQLLLCDIVIIHLPQAESIITVFLAKILRKKIYCIYQCELKLADGLINKIIEIILILINIIVCFLSDKIITNTNDFAVNSTVLKFFLKKIEYIIPPIISPRISKITVRKISSKFFKKKYVIGFLGRISSEKGLNYLLKAVPYFIKKIGNNFTILISGPNNLNGEEEYNLYIKKLIKKFEKNITYIGALQNKEVGSFFSIIDVLVLPSINSTESFGMVQVEAMYCGVPVVATNIPGVRVPIQLSGMGMLIKTNSTISIVESVVNILKNKHKFIYSRQKIKNIFSLKKTINKFHQILYL